MTSFQNGCWREVPLGHLSPGAPLSPGGGKPWWSPMYMARLVPSCFKLLTQVLWFARSRAACSAGSKGLVACFREGGEEHGGENRDDGDDDQQLDQREMTVFFHVLFPF